MRTSFAALFLRSRGGAARTGLLAAVVTVALLLAPVDLLAVPLRGQVNASPMPNAVLLVGALVSFSLASPWRDLHELVPLRRLVLPRALWYLALTACLLLAGYVALAVRGLEPFAAHLLRSGLAATGAGALSACLLPRSVSWTPVLLYGMVSWVWGTVDQEGTARVWSLPNQPLDSAPAAAVAAAAWLVGGLVFTWRDGRQVG
ncbi:hypothetical protein [Pseudokineococcus sp. 1T1Z-3]|uniref:hypothetical protein n=1 Tax=Pseudokineococcus sp. 1T1Z-3 TaxID=3132745 RepID=UPI00309CC3C6